MSEKCQTGTSRRTRDFPIAPFSAKWHRSRIVIGVGNQMAEQQIRFDDGASYEQMMGIWSRSAGEIFLDWLAPPLGMRWIDIGCGKRRSKGSIHPKSSSRLHAPDLRRAWQSFTKAMPWPCLSPTAASMRL